VPAVNGWALYFHSAFKDKFEALPAEVQWLKELLEPDPYLSHPKVKLLERLRAIVFEEIPRDPGAATYEQGNTLGTSYRHWKRAKFLGRFRLFFRFSSKHKIIVYAWVNDENTLRKAGAKTDPYVIFEKRVRSGEPPDHWDDLVACSSAALHDDPALREPPNRGGEGTEER
jgi:toxin YhaV